MRIFLTFHQAPVWADVRGPKKLTRYAEFETVHGHAGKLLFGKFESEALPVVLMVGRVQFVTTPSTLSF